MLPVVNAIAICLYLLAALYQGRYLFSKTGHAPRLAVLFGLGFSATLAHAVSVTNVIYNGVNIDLSFFKVASLISWFIAFISIASLLRRPTNNLLVALLPLAALCTLLSHIEAPHHDIHTVITPGLLFHILSSILAYSLLTMASIQAVTLALQERHLKHHHLGGILRRLPPLQTMEQMLFELIWIGMGLLSLSLISGTLFIDDLFAQHLVHKTFFTLLAWVIFAILLWGRHWRGWRGQTAVRWTLVGFTTLMLGYFGSKFVLELLLARNA